MRAWRISLAAVALLGAAASGVAVVDGDDGTVSVGAGAYTVTLLGVAPGNGAATGINVLSDGDVVIGRQLGQVSRFDTATSAFTTLRTVPIAVPATGQIAQAGLLDLTTSADDKIFVSYLCYRTTLVVHCVDEFDGAGTGVRTSRWGVNYTHAFTPGNHNGGGIAVDDNFVYVGTGDDLTIPNPSQNPASLKGKIVRLQRSTLGSPTVVVTGIRQPFGMIRHGSELIEFEVGKDSWEEINRFTPDAATPPNMGWNVALDGDASAWLCYRHPGISGKACDEPTIPDGFAVMGGAIVGGELWFADHALGWVGHLPLDRSGPFVVEVSSGISFPTKLAAHPNGRSVYVLGRDGQLWQVDPGDTPPPPTTTTTTTTTIPTGPVGSPPKVVFGEETVPMSFPITVDDVDADAVTARFKVEMAHADQNNNGQHEHPVVPWTDFDPAVGTTAMWDGAEPIDHEDLNIWWRVYVESTDAVGNATVVIRRVEVPSSSTESEQFSGPGATTTTTTTTTTVPQRRRVVFVVGSTAPLPSRDLAFESRMRAAGHTVTTIDDDAATAALLDGAAVVISTSVNVATAERLVATLDEPIVTWEAHLAQEIGVANAPAYKAAERTIATPSAALSATADPLTAGLTTPSRLFTTASASWSSVQRDAVVGTIVGTAATNSNVVVIARTARNVLLPYSWDSQDDLTNDGWRLFDNSVGWAVTR